MRSGLKVLFLAVMIVSGITLMTLMLNNETVDAMPLQCESMARGLHMDYQCMVVIWDRDPCSVTGMYCEGGSTIGPIPCECG